MDPQVVTLLEPYIVTSWHGHRDSQDIPAAVQTVWKQKFASGPPTGARPGPRPEHGPGPGRGPGPGPGPRGQQSNVDLAVLSPSGEVVHAFDGFRHGREGERESLAEYTARELRTAAARLGPAAPRARRETKLPDLGGARGMRLFVTLEDDRMSAYRAPIVEVVALGEEDWSALRYPEAPRSVEASALRRWLAQVYPPGVMERVDPVSKRVYRIRAVAGALSLAAAGSDERARYAVLTGEVRLTDEGPDDFSYGGRLEAVIAYDAASALPLSVRGTLECVYPRQGPPNTTIRRLPLIAVFESLPEAEAPAGGR